MSAHEKQVHAAWEWLVSKDGLTNGYYVLASFTYALGLLPDHITHLPLKSAPSILDARDFFIELGLLESRPTHYTWELTDAGRELLMLLETHHALTDQGREAE